MKCPKCGYNSFEFYDICTKCSGPLSGTKENFGLKPIVLPQATRVSMAASILQESKSAEQPVETAGASKDIFTFDFHENTASTPLDNSTGHDPFNFDDSPKPASSKSSESFSFDKDPLSAQEQAEKEAFASLLQSDFDKPISNTPPATAANTINIDGEFNLDNFNWDITPPTPQEEAAKIDDDLKNLFGDLDGSSKK